MKILRSFRIIDVLLLCLFLSFIAHVGPANAWHAYGNIEGTGNGWLVENNCVSSTTNGQGCYNTSTHVFCIGNGTTCVAQSTVGINPRGAYQAGTVYSIGDSVSNNGSSYIAISATTGNLPTNTTYWQLLAGKGDTGSIGPSGKTVLNGSGAPSSGTGADGDFYIDTTAKCIYGPKSSGSWPGSCTSLSVPGSGALTVTTQDNTTTPDTPGTGSTTFYTKYGKLCSISAEQGEKCVGTSGSSSGYTTVPASPTATGTAGQWSVDSSYGYFCYATDSWIRVTKDGTWAASACATPAYNNDAGTYNNDVSVTISDATDGAAIKYCTDTANTCDASAGSTYGSAVSITSTGTYLRSIAIKSGLTNSSVKSALYTLTTATPSPSLAAGSYSSTQTVTLSSSTSGAYICYTTDGSTPAGTASSCTTGTHYAGSFQVSATETVKAVAYKANYGASSVMSATYTIGTAKAYVQYAYLDNGSASNGTASATAFSSSNTAGNAIVVFVNGRDDGSAAAASCTDSQSNTYVKIDATFGNVTAYNNPGVIFYALNIAGGSNNVVTCTWSSGGTHPFVNIIAAEVSGITALDKATAVSNGTGTPTSNAMTTTDNGEFVFAAIVKSSSVTAGSGYTMVYNGTYAAAEYQFQTTAGSITPVFTGSVDYSFHAATFK